LLGVAAQDELAHLGAVPQADNDERGINLPGDVKELIGQIVLVGRLNDSCRYSDVGSTPGGLRQDILRRH
jgi:hypothetical protein